MNSRASDFDVVVVGGGPAGLGAACAAAESGQRVALVDETPWLGGQIWRGRKTRTEQPEAKKWIERFRESKAALLDQTSVIAAPGNQVLLAAHAEGTREIRWKQLVIATGAKELFLPFPGWTLPGIVGPGGLLTLAKHGWPVAGKRIVIAGSGPLLLAAAQGLKAMGAKICCVAEQADWARVLRFGFELFRHPGKLRQAAGIKLELAGVPHRCGTWPVRADQNGSGLRVELTNGRDRWAENCDLLACGFGLTPNVELPLLIGCGLRNGFVSVDDMQRTSAADIYCAGEPTGIGGADAAVVEGQIAGYAASGNEAKARMLFDQRRKWHAFRSALARTFELKKELRSLSSPDTLVCRCEDVTHRRMADYATWREAKLQTRCGMGACQGRICGAASEFIFGWGMESVRPPILPARLEHLITTQKKEITS